MGHFHLFVFPIGGGKLGTILLSLLLGQVQHCILWMHAKGLGAVWE